MSGGSFIVKARSWAAIETVAQRIRMTLGYETEPYLPIGAILEKQLPDHVYVGVHENANDEAEAFTTPDGHRISFRADVYDKLCADEYRARFTGAHEFGHWLLHTGDNLRLERAPSVGKVAAYRMSEPQANQFAASILMPKILMKRGYTPPLVSRMFGVSLDAARIRLKSLNLLEDE